MITKRFMLFFPADVTEKPISYSLVKDYDLMLNVYRARVTPEEAGFMLVDITGEAANIDQGVAHLEGLGIEVSDKHKGLRWEQERCISCGACLTHCPTGALHIPDRKTMEVAFSDEKCVECLKCIQVCPFDACRSLI